MSYRYIGNKTRFLPTLMPLVKECVAPGATVADLMCGTASVSEALSRAGYRVIASDVMTFAVQHARVRLTLDGEPDFAGLSGRLYADVLDELQNLAPVDGYITREYSPAGTPEGGHPPRKYFSADNARKIDAIRMRLASWEGNGALSEGEKALLRHDLVLASNRVANIAGTYGHFRSRWSPAALCPLVLEPTKFESPGATLFDYAHESGAAGLTLDHVVLQGRAEDLAPELSADLCYLDPPYKKRQYAANYHLLETLARGDEPEAVGISGLRPWRDQYSDFCSKVRIRDAFAMILGRMDCPQYLISYSEDGLLSKDEMVELLSGFGKVELREFVYPRFRSNQSPLSANLAEYVFHLVRG